MSQELTPLERFWVYNIQFLAPILFVISAAICLIADQPGDNPGDIGRVSSLMGAVMVVSLLVWFGNTMYRDCTDNHDRDFSGRRRRAIETRYSRYGRPKVIAIPDGDYVKIKTIQPKRVTCWPALWPLSQPFSCRNDSDPRFHAERESERAMEYFNEQEAKIARNLELSDGEIEAKALADALNS